MPHLVAGHRGGARSRERLRWRRRFWLETFEPCVNSKPLAHVHAYNLLQVVLIRLRRVIRAWWSSRSSKSSPRHFVSGGRFDSYPLRQPSLAFGELRLGKPASAQRAKAAHPEARRLWDLASPFWAESVPIAPVISRATKPIPPRVRPWRRPPAMEWGDRVRNALTKTNTLNEIRRMFAEC